jgi:hypothetical protein
LNVLLALLGAVMLLVGLYWCVQIIRERPPAGVARHMAFCYLITWKVGAVIAFAAIALPSGAGRYAILALGVTFLAPRAYLAVVQKRFPEG